MHLTQAEQEAVKPLVEEALFTFEAAAQLRVREVIVSPPFDTGSFRSDNAATDESGFKFALHTLANTATYACEAIMRSLLQWHSYNRQQAATLAGAEDERSIRECAVNIVFCESTLAVMEAKRVSGPSAPRVLDALEQHSLEFFLSDAGQTVGRRRLAALDGRSEEALWTELVRSLSSYRFESIANKVLMQLEAACGGGARGRNAPPGRGVLA
eukprot:6044423-Prymnesium_polylepis.1